jgi:hypothetical protein
VTLGRLRPAESDDQRRRKINVLFDRVDRLEGRSAASAGSAGSGGVELDGGTPSTTFDTGELNGGTP